MFHLTFLGTSSGKPTKFRNVSGLAVGMLSNHQKLTKKTPWILIDCGEGTQHQLLKTNLSLAQLQAICITHVHGDHCYGLSGLLSSMAMEGRSKPLTLIAPKKIEKLLDSLTLLTELYFSFEVHFIAIESLLADNQTFCLNVGTESHVVTIETLVLSHRTNSYGFKITQKLQSIHLDTEKLTALNVPKGIIWRQLKEGKNVSLPTLEGHQLLNANDFTRIENHELSIIVAGDNDTPDLLLPALSTTPKPILLVHEATYTKPIAEKILSRKDGINPQHSTAESVAQTASLAQLPYLILTHFSSRYLPFYNKTSSKLNMGHIATEVDSVFQNAHPQAKFWLANDFDEFLVTTDEVVKKIES